MPWHCQCVAPPGECKCNRSESSRLHHLHFQLKQLTSYWGYIEGLGQWVQVLQSLCLVNVLAAWCRTYTNHFFKPYNWNGDWIFVAHLLLICTTLGLCMSGVSVCLSVCLSVACWYWLEKNKCIEDDTKAAARQSLNCIKNKKNKIWRKKIFNRPMPDGILTPCNMARSHWFR